MIQQERFLRIIEYLQENRTATFSEIGHLNGISTDTVRRDFAKMEKLGMLRRVRGGAIYQSNPFTAQQFNQDLVISGKEKMEMIALVDSLVADGQTIALNSGGLNIEIAKFLAENYERLTILTNDLSIIRIVAPCRDIMTLVPSGIVDPLENAIFGINCEQDILAYNADVAFLSAYAFSLEKGITDYRANHSGIISAMQKISRKVVAVVDENSFGKIACMNVCDTQDIDILLCELNLSSDVTAEFAAKGVAVIH